MNDPEDAGETATLIHRELQPDLVGAPGVDIWQEILALAESIERGFIGGMAEI